VSDYVLSVLQAEHDRAAFRCGEPSLDAFIRRHAPPNHARGISRVFVATRPGDRRVVGYYASAAGVFTRDSLPPDDRQGLPAYPLPTAHLGRLAVDTSCQGQGLGRLLLFHFLSQALRAADHVGISAVDVRALGDAAGEFYVKYGFIPLQDDDLHLYLPIDTVRLMFPVDVGPTG
jgi:GNAT superfamily N-acetyltransferase